MRAMSVDMVSLQKIPNAKDGFVEAKDLEKIRVMGTANSWIELVLRRRNAVMSLLGIFACPSPSSEETASDPS